MPCVKYDEAVIAHTSSNLAIMAVNNTRFALKYSTWFDH